MTRAYLLAAVALGLVGFAAVETASASRGVLAALTPYAWLDAAVYAVATLLLAIGFRPTFRRTRSWALPLAVLGFVVAFAPLAGVLAGAAQLTVDGAWSEPGLVQSAFLHTPLNLVYALALDLAVVAVPLGVASAAGLAWLARRGARRR